MDSMAAEKEENSEEVEEEPTATFKQLRLGEEHGSVGLVIHKVTDKIHVEVGIGNRTAMEGERGNGTEMGEGR